MTLLSLLLLSQLVKDAHAQQPTPRELERRMEQLSRDYDRHEARVSEITQTMNTKLDKLVEGMAELKLSMDDHSRDSVDWLRDLGILGYLGLSGFRLVRNGRRNGNSAVAK